MRVYIKFLDIHSINVTTYEYRRQLRYIASHSVYLLLPPLFCPYITQASHSVNIAGFANSSSVKSSLLQTVTLRCLFSRSTVFTKRVLYPASHEYIRFILFIIIIIVIIVWCFCQSQPK
jgi:hypothetical protein